MERLCVTYNDSKPSEVAKNAVVANCKAILDGNASLANLRKLCGSVVYNFVFLIPDYTLESGTRYTIEQICLNVRGLLSMGTHELLEDFGNICVNDTYIIDRLYSLLHNCLFGEVVALTGLQTRDIYVALFLCYASLTSNTYVSDKLKEMYTNSELNYLEFWQLFESEVYHGKYNIS